MTGPKRFPEPFDDPDANATGNEHHTLTEAELQRILAAEDLASSVSTPSLPPGTRPPARPFPEPPPDFETVYRQAGVPGPPHGYSAPRVASMLAAPRLASLPPPARATAVRQALDVAGVPVADVFADAAARERALADYEARWAVELAAAETERRVENAALEAEIARYVAAQRARIDANEAAVARARAAFAAWREARRAEAQRLADAVRPLTPPTVPPPLPPRK